METNLAKDIEFVRRDLRKKVSLLISNKSIILSVDFEDKMNEYLSFAKEAFTSLIKDNVISEWEYKKWMNQIFGVYNDVK